MSRTFDVRDPAHRGELITTAAARMRRGEVTAAPDGSMYSLVCDAFSERGVSALRDIKGRSRLSFTVLVGRPGTVDGVAVAIPPYARDLMAALWPGPLTLLLRQQPSLTWPLAAAGVSVRMPLHPVLLHLVRELGPTAATTASVAGLPAVTGPRQFHAELGDEVDLFLDAGDLPSAQRSTVVDATGEVPVVRRTGAFSVERIGSVCPDVVSAAEPDVSGLAPASGPAQ